MARKAKQAKAKTLFTVWEDPAALKQAMEEYFQRCDDERAIYGEAGLALHLNVSLETLRGWFDGKEGTGFQDAAKWAYLNFASQLESGSAFRDKTMATRAIFLAKQPRLLGYQDKVEASGDIAVKVTMGKGMDASDFA